MMNQAQLKMRLKRAEEGTTRWLLKELLDEASDFEDCDDPALLKKRLREVRSLAEDLAGVFPDLQYKKSLDQAPRGVKMTQAAEDIFADLYLTGDIQIEKKED